MMKFLTMIGMFIWLATAALPAAASKKPNPAALALFRKATQSSNIEAKNGTPFRLQATVRAFGAAGKHADGVAIEFWTPDHKSRTETMFAGYSRVEVRDGKKIWEKKSTEYSPLPVWVAWQAMEFDNDLQSVVRNAVDAPRASLTPKKRERAKLELGKPKGEGQGKRKCVEVEGKFSVERRYCFDSASGFLAEIRGGDLGLRYEFGDYEASGTKTFPRSIRVYYGNGGPLVDIRIVRIDPLPNPNQTLFLPVPGSQEEGGNSAACKETTSTREKVKKAKLLKMVQPVYPAMAKLRGISGRVVFHAVIGKDGAPHALWLVESPARILAEAALEAVRQWRYRPTMLCGEPVQEDTVLTVSFDLQ